VNNEDFVVDAPVNECTAKADAAAWEALGCDVVTDGATTVTGLGTVTAFTGFESCAITCPVNDADFVVAAVATTDNGTRASSVAGQVVVALLLILQITSE